MDDATSAMAIRITLGLWPLMAGLVLLPLTITAAMTARRKQPPPLWRERLTRRGLGGGPSRVMIALGLLWLTLFALCVAGLLWMIGALMWRGPLMGVALVPDDHWHLPTLSALTTALGAIVALPFTRLRTGFAARRTRTAWETRAPIP